MVLLLYFTMQWCSIYSIFILFVVSLKELQRRQEETSCSRRSFSHAKPLQTPKYTSLIHMQHLPDQDILQRKNVTCVARLLYSYLETFRRIILFIRNFAEKGEKVGKSYIIYVTFIHCRISVCKFFLNTAKSSSSSSSCCCRDSTSVFLQHYKNVTYSFSNREKNVLQLQAKAKLHVGLLLKKLERSLTELALQERWLSRGMSFDDLFLWLSKWVNPFVLSSLSFSFSLLSNENIKRSCEFSSPKRGIIFSFH